MALFWIFINGRYLLFLCVLASLARSAVIAQAPDSLLQIRQAAETSPLVNFQVYEPVLTPTGPSDEYGCVYTKLLMDHVFAFSYGKPFVGSYTPPPCDFNRVTMNLTVTSKGRQFDRLGLMYLGDIEVFRTSTAEPTSDGIVWTYIKEMEQYNVLWKTEQKLIFDLGNLVNEIYTGTFNATLTATFFTVPDSRAWSDLILPISAKQSSTNMGSAFNFPSQVAKVAYQLPQNINRAVISLSACGQAAEEFWYTNVLSSEEDTFAASTGTLSGYSPFREVQLLVDGQLAGVSWPYPVIFTGGIAPGFWRPIAGIDAFDLREHEIDITPWLPLLCDSGSHTFEIKVVGLDDDGAGDSNLSQTVGSYWVVTGKIFLFLDKAGSATTGSSPTINTPPPQISISSTITTDSTGTNKSLTYDTLVTRDLSISSTIITSSGSRNTSWTQHLSYSSSNALLDEGSAQETHQNTAGSDSSSGGYNNTYNYPLSLNSSFFVNEAGEFGLNASLSRGLTYNIFGPSVFPSGIQAFDVSSLSIFNLPGLASPALFQLPTSLPVFSGALLSTTQTGRAEYRSAGNRSYSYGTTEQDFTFKGATSDSEGEAPYELYKRYVRAEKSKVTEDSQTLTGQTLRIPRDEQEEISVVEAAFEGFSVKSMLGRGPGKTKGELAGGADGVN
ncbi:hypothetical protein MMC22_011668 [Lobaria immixta]|nr:hypothetical protein [Lobaria immixta]